MNIVPLTTGEDDSKLPNGEKPVLEICTHCPIMMVGLNKYRIVHKPCGMHGAMQRFFEEGGEVWV